MSDSIYRKQLEAYGIESTRIVAGDVDKKRRNEEIEALLGFVKILMSSIQGRHWVYSMLELTQAFTPPFALGKPDLSAFLSGAQAVGMKLFQDVMSVAPGEFVTMIVEADARKRNLEPQESE